MIKTPLSTVIDGAFWTPGATVIGGNTPAFDQQIQKLFANGEQGFVYDPNDLSTMFQDAAGTVPVTAAGQPVGLILDKSKGLVRGVELMTNGDFSNGKVGWTDLLTTSTVSNGVITVTISSTGGRVVQTVYVEVGKSYEVTWYAEAAPSEPRLRITSNAVTLATVNGQGNLRAVFTAIASTAEIRLTSATAGNTAKFGNISVREITGNHTYQTTSSMRPLLVASPQRLDYDTVDDELITTLPAQLTGCTVVRAVPNVGTQILAGQTIPTTYNDNTDHCGLIVINRALTATEISQITKLFNKAAGV